MFTENDAYIVGLTGMSGAGKTTACQVFSDCGFAIINCDLVSRAVVEKGRPALSELEAHFGTGIILTDGTLDRKTIGNLIFSDKKAREEFNEIIYPYISYEMIISAVKYINSCHRFILLDAPTLFESGIDSFCDIIVSVIADREECLRRIMTRDKLTFDEARNRLLSQFSPEFYREKSDFCAVNKGTVKELQAEIKRIAQLIGEKNA